MQIKQEQLNIENQILNEQNSKSFLEQESEIEDIEDYNIGGFHPIFIGEILNDRYLMRNKIKTTQYSQIWMAIDIKYNIPVCIKMYQASPYYTEVGLIELQIIKDLYRKSKTQKWIDQLSKLKEQYCLDNVLDNENFCVKYLNSFKHDGPHGTHLCIVYEYLGITLEQFLENYSVKELPYPVIKKIALQIAIGIKFLHQQCQLIHCNLKPSNIMLTIPFNQLVIQKEIQSLKEYNIGRREFLKIIIKFTKSIKKNKQNLTHFLIQSYKRRQLESNQIGFVQKLDKKDEKKVKKKKKKIKKNNVTKRRDIKNLEIQQKKNQIKKNRLK